jgi:predicted lipid-binding transport protein (Tim44 family)/uncharacterized tellurite resistance protein B-like protein
MRQEDYARTAALERLTSRDPGFSEDALLTRVQTAFLKIQDAWCQHKLDDIRPFISDGIYERFALQVAEQQDEGVRDHMERLTVDDLYVAQVDSDRLFDTVTVAVSATAVDYQVDAKTGRHVRGSKQPESFTEYWSFLRKPGATSLNGNGLIEGNCPNCGASLHLNEAATCSSCNALIKSGEYDWVLAEITQACEWHVRAPSEVPGVSTLVADDPGFSVQHLEDRASVMFWRLMASWRTGKTDPVRKMATDTFCDKFAATCAPNADGSRSHPADCAVGAVTILGILRDEPMDTALVEVRWSAAQVEISAGGDRRATAASAVKTDIFLLVRGHDVKTDAAMTLNSAHCPGCGAPAAQTTAAACEYCGAVLNGGEHDWVLADRRPPFDQEIVELRRQLDAVGPTGRAAGSGGVAPGPGAVPGSMEVTAWLVTVMIADGTVTDEELDVIHSYGSERGIAADQVDRIIQAVQAGQLEAPQPKTTEEARAWLNDMAGMALADGFIAEAEHEALMAVGSQLGMTEYDVNQTIARKRRELYQAAKENMRAMRRKR